MARKLVVEIVGDASSLEREFRRSAKGAQRFERQIGQIGRGTVGGVFSSMGRQVAFASGGFLGAAGLVAGLKASVTAASDLNEEVSKSRQVFGGSAAAVRAWARDAPEALKLSQTEALAATSGFGAMLETAGLADDKAAQMSVTMTGLGADMASFNNEDPSDMLDRLRSGLAGEAEPLRRFGVLLSEARVAQEAHRMGLVHGTQKLSEQQKVLARYSILMRDTVKQQGDAARTGGQFAGQQRELRARLQDTAAAIGTALLPKITKVATKFNDWLANTKNQKLIADDATEVAKAFAGVAKAIGDVKRAYDWLSGSTSVLDSLRTVGHAMETPGWKRLLGVGGQSPGTLVGGIGGGNFDIGLRPDDRAVGPRRPSPAAVAAVRAAISAGGAGVSAGQRNQWFDSMLSRRLDRVQDVRTLQGQVRALSAIAGLIRDRLAKTKDITRRMTLEDELVDVMRQRSGLNAQILANRNERERLRLLTEAEQLAAKRARSLERLRNAQSNARAAFGELGQGPLMQGPMMDMLRQWGGKARAADFIADLRRQVTDFATLQRDMATLRKRGVSQFAIQTLMAQGQGGAEEAHALAAGSRGQIATFNRLIGQRRNLVQQAANVQVRTPRVTVVASSVSVHGSTKKTSQADNRAGARGTGRI